jgi:hypothetical protein
MLLLKGMVKEFWKERSNQIIEKRKKSIKICKRVDHYSEVFLRFSEGMIHYSETFRNERHSFVKYFKRE